MDGIIKAGIDVKVRCTECNEIFTTKEGTITIKGVLPKSEICKECMEKLIIKSVEKWESFPED